LSYKQADPSYTLESDTVSLHFMIMYELYEIPSVPS
jgi:hypothetical protein